ncbi:hypothetical protein TrLO_g720 [Triparma laevis f. longispina]|uniref:Alkaline ceramidase n=1 Tax=Triparma laevis f. longispina TaxID=1714387 RepID=A0A9W7FR51_9STRA|nr:hypothetical protein TrLO_g720 [Triparma laevis f. longispina]
MNTSLPSLWCEYVVSPYSVSTLIAEWVNTWTNVFYPIVALYGLQRLSSVPSTSPFLKLSELILIVVSVGSFCFHAAPSAFTELLDEFPMILLALSYLLCLTNKHALLRPPFYVYTFFLTICSVVTGFIAYQVFGEYEIFLMIFTAQTVFPILICLHLLYTDKEVAQFKTVFLKSLACIAVGRGCWEYERLLYSLGVCPTAGGRQFLHGYWHLFSALSHGFLMAFLRQIDAVKNKKKEIPSQSDSAQDLEMQRLIGRTEMQAVKE